MTEPGLEKFLAQLQEQQRRAEAEGAALGPKAYDERVSTFGREELDAKLQAVEARMDARVASIEGKIDTMLARIEGAQSAHAVRFDHLAGQMTDVREDVRASRQEAKSYRIQIVLALIATGVGIVFGLGSINASLFETFGVGRGAGSEFGSLTEKVEQLRKEAEAAKSVPPPLQRGK